MLNAIEFVCDSCRRAATIADAQLAADAESQLANSGWLVKGIAGRIWHFCPTCRAKNASAQLNLQGPLEN